MQNASTQTLLVRKSKVSISLLVMVRKETHTLFYPLLSRFLSKFISILVMYVKSITE